MGDEQGRVVVFIEGNLTTVRLSLRSDLVHLDNRVALATRIETHILTPFLLIPSVADQLHTLHKTAHFELSGRFHALLGPTRDDLLVKVRMGVPQLFLIKVVDPVQVPEALPDVANTA